MNEAVRSIWVLADDRAGNRAQALGVAEALGRPYVVKDLAYGALAALPNALAPSGFATLDAESRSGLEAPWPDLVIAAGRRTAPITREIKRLGEGRPKLVQIMNPGGSLGDFALVGVPAHDPPVIGANVVTMVGSPHGLTAAKLAEARAAWAPRLTHLPAPRIALIVGGSTRRRDFSPAMARDLAARAGKLATDAGGSLMVTTSRRSGAAADVLLAALPDPKHVFRWGDEGDNPYTGYLASADAVIVTGESMSMCSEACAGTGPVYVYAPQGLITPKHGRFHDALYAGGYARPLGEGLTEWSHPPLDPAAEIVKAMRRKGVV
ncbi:MAG: mitochondrial fission ELM1 family protein [Rhodospirillaceae bacterium]